MIRVPFVRVGDIDVPPPQYQTEGAVGMDLYAAVPAPVTLTPGARARIKTGYAVAIPQGFEGQVRPRSGLSLKHGVTVLNTPGTIDPDYRGELMVVLINHGHEPFMICRGDRIAQLVICPVVQADLFEMEALDPTARGSGGFGSTDTQGRDQNSFLKGKTHLFKPFPQLETSRLSLRELTINDAEAIFRICLDPEAMRYGGSSPLQSIKEAVRTLRIIGEGVHDDSSIQWAITIRESKEILGSAGFWHWVKPNFRAKISYELSRAHWSKGIMTESLSAIVQFGFRVMGLHSIEANVDPQNATSIRLLQRLGFRQEGLLRENFFLNGRFYDTAVFSLQRI